MYGNVCFEFILGFSQFVLLGFVLLSPIAPSFMGHGKKIENRTKHREIIKWQMTEIWSPAGGGFKSIMNNFTL